MPYISDWMSISEACAHIAGVEGCDSISALKQLRSAYLDGKIRTDRQWKAPGTQLKVLRRDVLKIWPGPTGDASQPKPARTALAGGAIPKGAWSREQACAWHVWRDLRVVLLVGPKDGDDDDTLTVERLLKAQKKAVRSSWYKEPRTGRTVRGPGFVMFSSRAGEDYGPSFLAEMLPWPVGSIKGFERAVAKGQVTESEFHTFDPAQMMREFPAPDRNAAETVESSAKTLLADPDAKTARSSDAQVDARPPEADAAEADRKASRRKGRRPNPIWEYAKKEAMQWFDENGYPEPGDGGQARLEKHIKDRLGAHDQYPAESTIRKHVVRWIKDYRDGLA
jgi:hypothetical protein